MSFRYIGSKARVTRAILDRVGEPDGGIFHDAFSGTGVVARAASEAGWKVHVNDHLISSAIMSLARVTSSEQADFSLIGGYSQAIDELNAAEPVSGFIWREYSPASARHCDVERMYFTEHNAKKIDGMRRQIEQWRNDGSLNDAETYVLIADLMGAANRVANTAGTYGCFLSRWQKQSLANIAVVARILPQQAPHATMTSDDVAKLHYELEDTVYFDPPYTKRQYAAYYHVLETIALGDEPTIGGVCGIRPWKDKASDYCYKARAAMALERLVEGCRARRVFLSYSAEGHVSLDVLASKLENVGRVQLHDLDQIGRYRPNRKACQAGSEVQEVLFEVQKSARPYCLTA
ncbi:MAG: DNA adenine methylase [Gammaproteobacteria bacterium]|nr:DNA adenine methylase [Gammaproteobacteria bacterium]